MIIVLAWLQQNHGPSPQSALPATAPSDVAVLLNAKKTLSSYKLKKARESAVGSQGEGSLWREALTVVARWDGYELEHQRPACDDATATREEVPSNDVLENTALAAGLASNHNNLREVDGITTHRVENILELVDHRDQLV